MRVPDRKRESRSKASSWLQTGSFLELRAIALRREVGSSSAKPKRGDYRASCGFRGQNACQASRMNGATSNRSACAAHGRWRESASRLQRQVPGCFVHFKLGHAAIFQSILIPSGHTSTSFVAVHPHRCWLQRLLAASQMGCNGSRRVERCAG